MLSASEASRMCTGEIPFMLSFGCPQDRQGMPHCVRNDKIVLFLSREAISTLVDVGDCFDAQKRGTSQ
jgi:hypothetical protein